MFAVTRGNLHDCTGDGARSFRDYLNQADSAIDLIGNAVHDLGILYDSYRGIVESCLRDLIALSREPLIKGKGESALSRRLDGH